MGDGDVRGGTLTPRIGRRLLLVSAIIVILAALGVALGLALSGSGKSTGAKKHHPVQPCAAGGCAVVNKVQSTPQVVVYTGASCKGVQGPWFLNVVEGGSATVPRLSYRLTWAFTPGSDTAAPSGTISVTGGAGVTPKVTLANGVESLSGVKAGTPVTAHGSLLVKLSQPPSGATLTVSETGLAAAESDLHISSPLEPGGPVTLPVQISTDYKGC